MRIIFVVLAAASVLVIPGCHKKQKTVRTPSAPQPARAQARPPSSAPSKPLAIQLGYTEQGVASWYGIPYHGRPAADGEIYDMEKLVAAHRVMPFNTWLRVTNLANNKSVDVRVIDRGPFVDGRIIDLSKAAARQIDLLGPGIGQVRLQVIAAPYDIPSNDFYAVQVGAFSIYANAERTRDEYSQRFGSAQLAVKQGPTPLWRVLVGKEPSLAAAQQLADELKEQDKNVFVVRLDETMPAASTPPAAVEHAPLSASPDAAVPPPQ